MHLNARPNEYQQQMGLLFDKTPKAVLAALAVSFVKRLAGEEDDARSNTAVQAALLAEWQILHENGIVPQRPPFNPERPPRR